MSAVASTSSSTGAGGRVRRGGLALVMVGALAVSVRGQVEAVEPLLGGMSVVLALTNDLAALLALNELMSTRRREVRRWAWAVLVLAGGTAAGLNTWHALEAGTLPALWAVVVGIGPVLLAVVLSHLVALVLTGDAPAGSAPVAPTMTTPTAGPVRERHAVSRPEPVPPRAPALPGVESSRAAQVPTSTLGGSGVQHGLSVVPAPRVVPTGAPANSAGREEIDPRAQALVAQLRDGAELTGASVADQFGCSPRTGRRLLRLAEGHADSTTPETSTREQECGTG